MTMHAAGTLTGKSWDEQPYSEIEDGPKLAHVASGNIFAGDIEGESVLHYLMIYSGDSVPFSGYERVTGRIGLRAGSFVLHHQGSYADGAVRTTWSVVPGSGTGDLVDLRGSGGYIAPLEQVATYTLDYDFEGASGQ